MTTRITFDQWEEQYKPTINTLDSEASFNDGTGGLMFETFGKEHEAVISVATQEPRRVWTLVDGDGEQVIINGYHQVNRVGYFVTENAWPSGTDIDVRVA